MTSNLKNKLFNLIMKFIVFYYLLFKFFCCSTVPLPFIFPVKSFPRLFDLSNELLDELFKFISLTLRVKAEVFRLKS